MKIITDGTLKFSSRAEFNDPFDCIADYDLKQIERSLSSRDELFKVMLKDLSPAKRISAKKRIINRMIGEEVREGYCNRIAEHWGICSLSTKNDSILMWSHYADKHQGFVVEFSTNQNENGCVDNPEYHLLSWPVEYSKRVPIRKMGDQDFSAVKDQFLYKADDWSYECEYRCLASKKGVGIHKINKKMISSVIFGVKMRSENINEVKDAIRLSGLEEQIKLKRARMVKGKYALEIVDL
ncbi:DUF2971 domain-containing protein [Edwardsiella tarda]